MTRLSIGVVLFLLWVAIVDDQPFLEELTNPLTWVSVAMVAVGEGLTHPLAWVDELAPVVIAAVVGYAYVSRSEPHMKRRSWLTRLLWRIEDWSRARKRKDRKRGKAAR